MTEFSLTPQTAACMMASKPHSGMSIFADTRCVEIIWLNLSVLLVSDKTCLYPKVGRQVKSGAIPLKHRFEKSDSVTWLKPQTYASEDDAAAATAHVLYLQGLASSSSVILMKGRVGFSTKDPKPIRNLLVRLAISLDKEEPRSWIFFRSSNMDADRSIR